MFYWNMVMKMLKRKKENLMTSHFSTLCSVWWGKKKRSVTSYRMIQGIWYVVSGQKWRCNQLVWLCNAGLWMWHQSVLYVLCTWTSNAQSLVLFWQSLLGYYTNIDCSWGKLCKITPEVTGDCGLLYFPRRSRGKYRPTVSSQRGELFCTISQLKSSQYFVLYNA